MLTKAQSIVRDEAAGNIAEPGAKWQLWTGRVLSTLAVLFLLFDAFGKFTMPVQVVQACQRLAFPVNLSPTLGVLLTIGTLLYAIPQTAVLGAVLLTGYLGGAVAIQMRAGSSLFEMVFPVIFGIVIWGGIYLRDARLRRVFPIR
jgi:DoxX-like family